MRNGVKGKGGSRCRDWIEAWRGRNDGRVRWTIREREEECEEEGRGRDRGGDGSRAESTQWDR